MHVSAYAFLSATAAFLHRRGRWRWLLPAGLVLHGGATELLQYLETFGPGRTGCWQDVALDSVGIAIGLALTWRRWLPDGAKKEAA